MRFFFITALFILLTSCAATNPSSNQAAENFQGMNISSVFKKLGTPDQTIIAPSGNKSYVYTKNAYQSYPASPVSGVHTVTTAGGLPIVYATPATYPNRKLQEETCTTSFEVNKQNVVVNIQKKGC
jgi:hypothetical protein